MNIYKQEKSDAVITVRFKSTTLATLARYFMDHGVFVVNKGGLIRLSLEAFEQYLVEEKGIERCISLEQARTFLASVGIGNLNPGGRLGQTFLEEGEREANFLDEDKSEHISPKSQKKKLEDMEPWQQEIVIKINKEREDAKERREKNTE